MRLEAFEMHLFASFCSSAAKETDRYDTTVTQKQQTMMMEPFRFLLCAAHVLCPHPPVLFLALLLLRLRLRQQSVVKRKIQ